MLELQKTHHSNESQCESLYSCVCVFYTLVRFYRVMIVVMMLIMMMMMRWCDDDGVTFSLFHLYFLFMQSSRFVHDKTTKNQIIIVYIMIVG